MDIRLERKRSSRQVDDECPRCEARLFWVNAGGQKICAQCRPPRDPGDVVQWIRPEGPRAPQTPERELVAA
jgi:hypothetical protein